MQESIRNPDFAAKLALAYGEMLDGIRPALQRVSMRLVGEGKHAELHMRNSQTQENYVWPVKKLRLIADQSRNDALVLAPKEGAAARLVIRDRHAAMELLKAVPRIPSLGRNPGAWPKIAVLGAMAAMSLAAILFVLVPHMANRSAEYIPPQAELALGDTAYQQFTAMMGATECKSDAGDAAVARMAAAVTQGVDLHMPLRIHVVDHPMVNAFALPGGQVVLHSALINAAETPNEVAAVLAHEVGHVYHRHSTSATIRDLATFGVVGMVFGDYLGSSVMVGMTNSLITSSHSRAAETEADEFAHQQLTRGGLPPSALGDMFRRMQAEGSGQDLGVMRHFSSHPEMSARIEASEAAGLGSGAGPQVLNDAEWAALRAMCN